MEGECISQFPESALATQDCRRTRLRALLIGEDPREVERLWHKLLARIWWYGPQGIAAFAVSAVDMALWDLKANFSANRSASCWARDCTSASRRWRPFTSTLTDLDWTTKEFAWFREQGYRIVKGGWGKS